MDCIRVRGGRRLGGTVRAVAAKNAALPILAATLLTGATCRLRELPPIQDVATMMRLLGELGVRLTEREAGEWEIEARDLATYEAPYELVRQMRASFLVMGPLLARTGRAVAGLPGGCAIGVRPIDLHLKGFAALGAEIDLAHGRVSARVPGRLRGAHVYLDYPSVTATENIMMAAVLAEGTTTIENAAEEPEVVDLANFLNHLGGRVAGAGTRVVRVEGVRELAGPSQAGAAYTPIPDRIEAGTFLVAGVITGGWVAVENVVPDHLAAIVAKLREAGAAVEVEDARVVAEGPARPRATNVKTLPYPGFPTDMQAPFLALLSVAQGTSVVTETVFENRFRHVEELKRMGARIDIEGAGAVVQGVERLTGAPVAASDLRAGAALVLAGLVAEGETEVLEVHHIDRGYHQLVERLAALGADIRRVSPAPVLT
ncbi:MAG: UDP-N-acetylglucosamine 1-carboxyvinyltransferase [Clostridia bacterium]|nr:UDP-N-acetylglucosamine 1-carboxyvinyltransferase [Clostridia bacterium]